MMLWNFWTVFCLLFFSSFQASCFWIQISLCNSCKTFSIEECTRGSTADDRLPLTCCSSVIITSTAMLRIPSFVWGLSDFRCDIHILPNSLRASLISRILILQRQITSLLETDQLIAKMSYLSRALLAWRRSFSLRSFSLGSKSSSSSSSSALEQLRDVLLLLYSEQ